MDTRNIAAAARRAAVSPYAGAERLHPPLIVHASHHKVGTVWFMNILLAVSKQYHLHFKALEGASPTPPGTHIAFYLHATKVTSDCFDFEHARVSHMVRDPRDIAVSGYYYHLQSKEEWLHQPRETLDGRTYQEYLQSLPLNVGLAEEIRRMARDQAEDLLKWDYSRPGVLELRYEDVLANEEAAFHKLFSHYGFRPDAVARASATALSFSLSRGGGSDHARSGQPGEWRDLFEDEHVALFKELFGDTLVQLGYETGNDWSK